NYGSGYSDGLHAGQELTEQLTGISLQPEEMPGKPVWICRADTIENPEPLQPWFSIDDRKAEPLAVLQENGHVVLASKSYPTHHVVFAGVPLQRSSVFRALLLAAGCRSWTDAPGGLAVSDQLILFHTGIGGKRLVNLKSGKTLELQLPKVATRLLDAQSGVEVLGD
ncbi:MAG: hypothetical protein ABIQ93_01575, partial [Saprospiraceae bacterium]